LTNNLSNIQALQNVPSTVTNYFRIVNWGATSSGGTWYIYDNPPAGTPAGTNGFVVIGGLNSLFGVLARPTWLCRPAPLRLMPGRRFHSASARQEVRQTNFWYQFKRFNRVSGSLRHVLNLDLLEMSWEQTLEATL